MPGEDAAEGCNPKLLRYLSKIRDVSQEQLIHTDLARDLEAPTLHIGGVVDHTDDPYDPDGFSPAEKYIHNCDLIAQRPARAKDPATRATLMPGAQLIEDKLLTNINDATLHVRKKLKELDSKD